MDERDRLLEDIKNYFREHLFSNHQANTQNLSLKSFKRNPLLESYLAYFAYGERTPETVAKVLVYPRVLGTSITTTLGSQIQSMCHEVMTAYASTTSGMDIEYISHNDGHRKYCQMKAGPQTINKDDVTTICNHFKAAKHLGRTNHLRITDDDCVVGIVYGTHDDISANYKKIETEGYTVLAGKEFWEDLTGDATFYDDLVNCCGELAIEANRDAFDNAVARVADELRRTWR